MIEINKRNKIILILIIITLIILFYIINKTSDTYLGDEEFIINNENIENQENTNENLEIEEESSKIYIHVAGEVKNPGVIEIEEGKRIIDIIQKAGGLTEYADISKINLAYEISDGQKIYIPNVNEIKNGEFDGNIIISNGSETLYDENKAKNQKININTAGESELQTLSGIGEAMARRIVEYREENGKFKNIEDIKNVSGIGESKFKNLEERICVK